MKLPGIFKEIGAAFQFLTRLPLPRLAYWPDALPRSARFFPLVGLAVGAAAAMLHRLLLPHLPLGIVALLIVLFSVLATGGLHEDGLADAADAFGGGWNRAQVLEILKDSRIGSYGTVAIVFSIAGRALLLASLPGRAFAAYVIAAHVLCRWTILPLGYILPAARRQEGQGARLARQVSGTSVLLGTLFAFGVAVYLLRVEVLGPIASILVVTFLSGLYYQRRIGGITGDCFGASVQLAEIAVYLCGVWR
jgi:adenosylcobinamide-GDP ribazoletransferase